MECIHCRGKMERKSAPLQINRHGYHLTIDSIPAWICSQCGEVYFEEQAVDKIQETLKAIDEKTKELHRAA